ncbi:MAG: 2-oxoglutarate dehydrogenase complex dihydrolipoyllysine-residue succinyltransferase [Bacteroidales bacterium]|nr:2-oxoglutarate dehydrogenase complex dihydrolipoyllysine-residue succinyltransferase [Bacteroidales bacterium]MCF8352239.1 2-oxoglutarate dehydrogenase complex dihydrolipoyllysine-residue succinyltransferase [Bacteroidales bacterium]MCF8374762.1 2-oxoglutarate dehydrogenase complex dihydrolipoyllysine-residue succinyltransferase [Bacteroidales bacterium]MCF8399834.1 2-oxoglutarate dehydrogenase complex dihydrolipoyllysine-residue succinyltransferase [Bacteroidales bacterium]
MVIEVKVPSPGESITEVQLANWLVENGEHVEKDQEIAEIDSDKATLSISAAEEGEIELLAEEGDNMEVDSVIAKIDTDKKGTKKKAPKKDQEQKPEETEKKEAKPSVEKEKEKKPESKKADEKKEESSSYELHMSPLAKKLMEKEDLKQEELVEFFKRYRISKKDVSFFLENKDSQAAPVKSQKEKSRDSQRKKMSALRIKLSERLVNVKNQTAMLTTFNEVNMTAIMEIRKKYKDAFKEKYGIGLGFMSFFTKAIAEALQQFPMVNAQKDGNEIVYHNYCDIGIAVSAPKGLMVPILRNAESMSFNEIEQNIRELADKARNNKLSLEEMEGGTFTITNGGVFGSMLSTPIINPPQSAILGMHNIVERPVALKGKVEIHPVMYVALSYDHRIIDGKDSVSFLVKVKEMLEHPGRLITGGEDTAKYMLGL